MENYYKKSIQAKVFAYVFGFFLVVLLLIFLLLFNQAKVGHLSKIESDFRNVAYNVEIAAHAQSKFMIDGRKEEKFLTSRQSDDIKIAMEHLKMASETLDQIVTLNQIDNQELIKNALILKKSVNTYRSNLKELVKKIFYRGFKDHGLEGTMRDYVHPLQKLDDPNEQIFALSLRRHEKDFMLRKDLKYVDKILQTAEEFRQYIKQSNDDQFIIDQKTDIINKYVVNFNNIVEIEKEIGLTEDEAIRGTLSKARQSFTPVLDVIEKELKRIENDTQKFSQIVIVSSIAFCILFTFLLGYQFSRVITKPIKKLNRLIKEYHIGEEIPDSKFESLYKEDEMGSLVKSFRNMYLSVEDSLHASIKAQQELKVFATEIENKNRYSEYLNKLINSINGNYNNTLREVVEVSGAQLGAIYSLSDNKEFMEMVACYAFSRKKYTSKEFTRGEGMVGAAWLEKEPIYRTEIPQNYMNITSGLGETKPSYLIIVPLIHEDEVVGILELAFLISPQKLIENLLVEFGNRLASEMHLSALQKEKTRTLEYYENLLQEKSSMVDINKNELINVGTLNLIESVFNGIIITNDFFEILFSNEWIKTKLNLYPQGNIFDFIKKRDIKKVEQFLFKISTNDYSKKNKNIEIELSGMLADTIVSLRVIKFDYNGVVNLMWLFNSIDFYKVEELIQNLIDGRSLSNSND
ncbi:GAF domain-containing protein [Marinigracilibium pacificum]|uniref:GAF domain-containing protein n=1 Tax=Marinigracilibium pacificum TaxID=2729599 RepID=A0A848IRF4_9BACT|nr:GAF domain-containing protein [Marinigracilibium pacificum]NMM47053.1 GAF domain-containing protein [Marinigracilibium pacificum]